MAGSDSLQARGRPPLPAGPGRDPIDRLSHVPRYWQVAVILATRIEDGTYKRRFPPLGELAAELRVERQTVRRGG